MNATFASFTVAVIATLPTKQACYTKTRAPVHNPGRLRYFMPWKVVSNAQLLSSVVMQRGDTGRALPLYERALAIWEAACGPDHPDVAHTLTDIAVIHLEQVPKLAVKVVQGSGKQAGLRALRSKLWSNECFCSPAVCL